MDVEDYIDVARRHKAWIVGPVLAALVISVVVAFLWRDTYVSEAVIRVVPPQVPERFVPSNVDMEMGQRINSMAQTVLSRARLTDMINSHGLYPSLRARLPMEDVIERMRRDIDIGRVVTLREQASPGRAPTGAFRIAFAYEERYAAQRVVQELVSRFIDESITARSSQSVMTTEFLGDQLEQAKRQLDQIENRLTEYKLKHAGRLPEQLQTNLQQLRTLETQLSSAGSAINRVTQEKLLLESQVRILKDQLAGYANVPESPVQVAAMNERMVQTEKQILGLETLLTGLRQQYTDTHPDVRRAEAQLATLKRNRDVLLKEEEEREKERAANPEPKVQTAVVSQQAQQLEADIQRTQSLIQAKDMELEQIVKDQDRLNALIRQFQQKVEASPIGEQMYAELSRDYDLARKRYEELSMKRSYSEIATDLESRKQGETLELLDPASLPQKPTEPRRWLIISTGTSLGLVLGLFLVGGREMRDTSLKNLKDVRAYTGLPVLGSIPLLENDLLVRRKRRLAWLAWSTLCILGSVVMLASVYYYYTKGS